MNHSETLTLSTQRQHSYSIVIEKNSTKAISSHLEKLNIGKNIIIVTNTALKPLFVDNIIQSIPSKYTVHCIDIPSGEAHKTLSTVENILSQALEKKLERNDTIIAIGGGVIGDMTGFAASAYLRGIRLIQIPTTLLAQVDSAIGGKTGVNHHLGKNLIGAFYQPELVLIDPNILSSLPKREIKCGLAEVIKYGIIKNPTLFEFIENNIETIKALDPKSALDIWTHLIKESAKDKVQVVEADEKEGGIRAILNFGHTIGHAIEAATQYKHYLHGEAIAIGMLLESEIAVAIGVLENNILERIRNLLSELDYDLRIKYCQAPQVYDKLSMDKKIINGKLRFVLPENIGKTCIKNDIEHDTILSILNKSFA